MQYEIIATVRLLIIAEIYGLTDAELRARSNLQGCDASMAAVYRRARVRVGFHHSNPDTPVYLPTYLHRGRKLLLYSTGIQRIFDR